MIEGVDEMRCRQGVECHVTGNLVQCHVYSCKASGLESILLGGRREPMIIPITFEQRTLPFFPILHSWWAFLSGRLKCFLQLFMSNCQL